VLQFPYLSFTVKKLYEDISKIDIGLRLRVSFYAKNLYEKKFKKFLKGI